MQEFKKASEIDEPDLFAHNMRHRINNLWGILGCIMVECPKCSHTQKINSVKTTVCRNCHTRYKICPKNKTSRIVWCDPYKTQILFEIQRLELDAGKYGVIF